MMPNDRIHRYAIAPGAELMVDPMPQSSGVAIGLWFPVGSAYERDSERGLSHFVEHMVFKGAGSRDAEELSRAIDRVGGYLNAFTEREAVCLHCLIPSEFAGLAIEVLLDMAYRPRLAAKEFEREKDVIINEIMAAEDDIEEAAQDLGADVPTVFRTIVLPLLRPAFISTMSYTFVRSMTAVSAIIFLISARWYHLTVQIYNFSENLRFGLASVLATALIIIVLVAFGVMRLLVRDEGLTEKTVSM